MFMQMTIVNNIKPTFPRPIAKDFMKLVEDCFQSPDTSVVGTLMGTLTT